MKKMAMKVTMKVKFTVLTVVLLFIGLVGLITGTIGTVEQKVTETMVNQFTNTTMQIARQAEIILADGGGVEELQTFVEEAVAENSFIAYAVVIDKTVTAVAHSDTEKIGKTYLDDVEYTVDAAQNGTIKTSSFYADVQKAWTYDVMVPIYQNGELYGSMDVGICRSV